MHTTTHGLYACQVSFCRLKLDSLAGVEVLVGVVEGEYHGGISDGVHCVLVRVLRAGVCAGGHHGQTSASVWISGLG